MLSPFLPYYLSSQDIYYLYCILSSLHLYPLQDNTYTYNLETTIISPPSQIEKVTNFQMPGSETYIKM